MSDVINPTDIDRKYKIQAVNPVSLKTHTEHDAVLFLAKDKALPDTISFYIDKCISLGANPEHIQSLELLYKRVVDYQLNVESKVPDTNLPGEIARCINGIGIDNTPAKYESVAEAIREVGNALSAAYNDITIKLPDAIAPLVDNPGSGVKEKYAAILDGLIAPIAELYKLAKLINPESEI